jgi:OOP family OmpA-OmpF porin
LEPKCTRTSSPDAKIVVKAYADSRSTQEYNLQLSGRRADAVKNYLVETGGVSPSRISTSHFGEENPIAANETRHGRAENRRAEIQVVPFSFP